MGRSISWGWARLIRKPFRVRGLPPRTLITARPFHLFNPTLSQTWTLALVMPKGPRIPAGWESWISRVCISEIFYTSEGLQSIFVNMALISFHMQNKPPFLWDPLSLFKVLGQCPALVMAWTSTCIFGLTPGGSLPFLLTLLLPFPFPLPTVYSSRTSTDQEATGCQEIVLSFVWSITIPG